MESVRALILGSDWWTDCDDVVTMRSRLSAFYSQMKTRTGAPPR